MNELTSSVLQPLLWPLPHIITAFKLTGTESPTVLQADPVLGPLGHISVCSGSVRAFLTALFLIYGLYDGDNYPAFGRGHILELSWMWPIVLRNLIATWLICGLWDYWLYYGPLKEKMAKFKILQKYPSLDQMKHDLFFTSLASLIAACFEIALCHAWSIGAIPISRSFSEKPLLHLILVPTITHWREVHFWTTHRLMHPWKTTWLPDFGKVLYKWVHSVHHKSYNVTTLSGTNMHPIEAAIYYSAVFMCVPLGVHPALALGVIVDCAMGAWVSHDGFVYPGGGDYYHTLHHLHFDCNYGGPHLPLDWITGVFIGSKRDAELLLENNEKPDN